MAADGTKVDITLPKGVQNPRALLPLIKGIHHIYTTKEGADLTIICHERKWRVHKLVLCAQSQWFRKNSWGPFKEAQKDTIHLDDDDPEVIDAMLHFLYNFDYDPDRSSREDTVPMFSDVRLFAIADKYFIRQLKVLAAKNFTKRAEVDWNTDHFADAIAEVYTTVPGQEFTLRKVITRLAAEHVAELFDRSEGHDRFRKVSREISEFGDDVLEVLAMGRYEMEAEVQEYCCPDCLSTFAAQDPYDMDFDCPNGCVGERSASWWAEHNNYEL